MAEGTEPIADDKCLCCGYPKAEEGCKTFRIVSYHAKADYIVVLCGREGLILYGRKD